MTRSLAEVLKTTIASLVRLCKQTQPFSFEVGPSQPYKTLLGHMIEAFILGVASISHRGDWFHKMFEELTALLKEIMRVPVDYNVFALSSGTEAMERAVQNLVKKGEGHKVVHLVYDAFSLRWYQTDVEIGNTDAGKIVFDFGQLPDLRTLTVPDGTELVFITINPTSTGGMIPAEDLAEFKKRYPDLMIAVDVVSSAPLTNVDFSLVDVAFASTQKCFSLMAGLCVVFVSKRAMERAVALEEAGQSTGSYHSFAALKKAADKKETPETISVWMMYLLLCLLRDYKKIGMGKLFKQTQELAAELYAFAEEPNGLLKPFIKEERYRSVTTLVFEVRNGSDWYIKALLKKGYKVSTGYGDFKKTQIRILLSPATLPKVRPLITAMRKIAD